MSASSSLSLYLLHPDLFGWCLELFLALNRNLGKQSWQFTGTSLPWSIVAHDGPLTLHTLTSAPPSPVLPVFSHWPPGFLMGLPRIRINLHFESAHTDGHHWVLPGMLAHSYLNVSCLQRAAKAKFFKLCCINTCSVFFSKKKNVVVHSI